LGGMCAFHVRPVPSQVQAVPDRPVGRVQPFPSA
jgi:hypothetical protein